MDINWEYKLVDMPQKMAGLASVKYSAIENELNSLGKQGWEAYQHIYWPQGGHLIFLKRAVKA